MGNEHLGNEVHMKAQENAKPLHASGRSVAFSIETVCTVLLLFIMLSVVVQFLGNAFVDTKKADGEMNAVVTARQIAEEFQGSTDPWDFAEKLGTEYNASEPTLNVQVEYVAGASLPAKVVISEEQRAAGTLYRAVIDVGSDENPSAVYHLETTHFSSDDTQSGGEWE